MADLKPVYLVCGDDDAKIDAWRARAAPPRGGGARAGRARDLRRPGRRRGAGGRGARGAHLRHRHALPAGGGRMPRGRRASSRPLTDGLEGDAAGHGARVDCPRKAAEGARQGGGGRWRRGARIRRAEALGAPQVGDRKSARAAGCGWSPMPPSCSSRSSASGQQRLAREIEKLAIAVHPEVTARAEHVEQLAAGETTPKVYDLADALVAGDRETTMQLAEELVANDERPSRFVYPIVGRLRDVHRAVELLEAGSGEKDVRERLEGAAVARKEGRSPRPPTPTGRRSNGHSAALPTSSWSYAEAGRSTRRPRSPSPSRRLRLRPEGQAWRGSRERRLLRRQATDDDARRRPSGLRGCCGGAWRETSCARRYCDEVRRCAPRGRSVS